MKTKNERNFARRCLDCQGLKSCFGLVKKHNRLFMYDMSPPDKTMMREMMNSDAGRHFMAALHARRPLIS